MPAPTPVDLDGRVATLLLGVAFSFLLRKRDEQYRPETRMHQINTLLRQVPDVLAELLQHRRELSLELGTLLRQGPDRYISAALRELKNLAKAK